MHRRLDALLADLYLPTPEPDFEQINEVNDCEAVRKFENLYVTDNPQRWSHAIVDWNAGLLLVSASRRLAVFVHNAVCGFNGRGPRTTARILAMAGFGNEEDLFRRVSDEEVQRHRFSIH